MIYIANMYITMVFRSSTNRERLVRESIRIPGVLMRQQTDALAGLALVAVSSSDARVRGIPSRELQIVPLSDCL